MYHLTREQLLYDLYVAFFGARRHKANKHYVKAFERSLKQNLDNLCEALLTRTYKASPSRCFVIEHPKKREVFAAEFVDRVVHHLYYNYTHSLFESTFIHDTYSCIEGRGTLFGIHRLRDHIRKESMNYSMPCYVLQLDITGYFMHIVREKLCSIATNTISRLRSHKYNGKAWEDVIDIDFVLYLTKEISLLDPTQNCIVDCDRSLWDGLDHNKSMFYVEQGCGLPIGNLTSQLFSNVYLNEYDQWMKRQMGCRHYGRYVDDSYVVSCDREWLEGLIPKVEVFLRDELCLTLSRHKTKVVDAHRGVEFLGAYIKPYRIYVSNRSLERMKRHKSDAELWRIINSHLGSMRHFASYNLRRNTFYTIDNLTKGTFDADITKFKTL